MTRFGVAQIIERAIARGALNCPSLRRKRLTAHSMRHTIAVHLLQGGADLVSIQNWLGHESIETVRVYLSLNLKAKRDILERCLSPDYVARRLEGQADDPGPAQSALDWLEGL
jgi:site-specific recombinase XerD